MKAILQAGTRCLWVLLPLLLIGCQSGSRSLLPEKQGYFTWVDASGQLHSTPVQRSDKKTSRQDRTDPVPGEGSPSTAGSAPVPGSRDASTPTGSAAAQPRSRAERDIEEPLNSAGSNSQAAASSTEPAGSHSANNNVDSEYTLANYPDAEALEKSGYIRPGDPLPYFTWQDSEGRVRVSYYRPDTRSDMEKGVIRQPIELTDGSIYTADSDQAAVKTPPLADGKVPEAFRVMGIDPEGGTLFQRWQALCCQTLTVSQVQEWSGDREFQLDMDDAAPDHRFSTGVSHFRLVKLPATSAAGGFVIRIRSFDDHGVYVPSLAFLDQSLKPLRLVTDLVMDFEPETWHRQGYLEAFVPVFPARGERWLLVFTRAEDLASQTVTDTRHGPRRVTHEPTGILSLTEVRP